MPNYNKPHQFYAGVDLHARSMFVRIFSGATSNIPLKEEPWAKRSWRGNTPGLDLVRLFGAAQF